MQKEKTKNKKSLHLGFVVMLISFFLVDTIMMFFFKPSMTYIALMLIGWFSITLTLFKVKSEFMFREVARVKALLFILIAVSLNTIVSIIRIMYF